MMQHALLWAAGGTFFLLLMTALGAAAVFLFPARPRLRGHLPGFAAGVMTAAAVWSLLLPAMEQAGALGLPPWLPAAAGTAAGGCFLRGMDALLARRSDRPRDAVLLAVAITLHNIPEGMAAGLSFALAAVEGSFAPALALALGIGVQNFPEGAAVALPLRQAGQSRRRAFALAVLSGAVEPLFGVAAAGLAAAAAPAMPWLLSFAAGAMLFVTAEELLPRSRSGGGFLAGFLLMLLLDTCLG